MFDINLALEEINNFIYIYILVALLIVCGLYFTCKSKFAQIRFFPDSIKFLLDKSSGKKVSSFQALMVSTATKVGTANIAGVATAIAIGGPGTIFWMWVMAIINSASSMAEATLAQIYKRKDEKNDSFVGGPAYYIDRALGKKKLGTLFSCLFLVCFLIGFNSFQASNMSTALTYYIPGYFHTVWPYIVAVVFAILVACVVFGGIHRISFVSSYLVPIMAMGYILMGLYLIITNITHVPAACRAIVSSAFNLRSIFGGVTGSVLIIGIKRGLLSNEAGMGSAPNAAATADVSHPAKQGIAQILAVCIDTILICSISAFILLLSNADLRSGEIGMPLMQEAISLQLGDWGVHFITLSIVTFAFSAIVGNFGICETNMYFITKNQKIIKTIRVISILPVALGCLAGILNPMIAWNIAEITMAFIACLNIIAILLLSKRYFVCLKDYINQRKLGKDPVFNAPACGIGDTDFWK